MFDWFKTNELGGQLRVADGELTVRLSLVRLQPFRHLKPWRLRIGCKFWIPYAVPLARDGLTWTDRDGKPCLHIRPPLYDMPHVWIWSADVDALQRTVERFEQF